MMEPNVRRCVSCRQLAKKQDFLRVVRTYPSGKVELEQGAGRSAYLCPQASCLQLAQKKNRLAKSLKVPVSESIYTQLWQRLSSH
jgi:hypothetical protein